VTIKGREIMDFYITYITDNPKLGEAFGRNIDEVKQLDADGMSRLRPLSTADEIILWLTDDPQGSFDIKKKRKSIDFFWGVGADLMFAPSDDRELLNRMAEGLRRVEATLNKP
jgi:hypothetical protein